MNKLEMMVKLGIIDRIYIFNILINTFYLPIKSEHAMLIYEYPIR